MISTRKLRTTAVATIGTVLVTAMSALVTAAPAAAAPRLVCAEVSGALSCHEARQCVVTITHADGTVEYVFYDDGETETQSGKNMKCSDGSWVANSRTGTTTITHLVVSGAIYQPPPTTLTTIVQPVVSGAVYSLH